MTKHEKVQKELMRKLEKINQTSDGGLIDTILIQHALSAMELLFGVEDLFDSSKELIPGFWNYQLGLRENRELLDQIAKNHHWSDKKEHEYCFEIYPGEWFVVNAYSIFPEIEKIRRRRSDET